MRFYVRWLVQHLALGLTATAVSIGVVALLDLLIDAGWGWERFALIFLALVVFLLLSALSTPGLNPTGVHGLGWDARSAYIGTVARENSGTLNDVRPPSGGMSALVATLPPFVAALVIVSAYL